MSIPTSYIPYINIALVVFLIVALIVGYVKGFLLQLVQTLTLIAALLVAWLLAPALAQAVKIWPVELTPFHETILKDLFYEKINVVLCFLVIFIVVLAFMLLLRPLIKAIGKIPVFKQINKVLGMVFSTLKYGIYLMIAIFIISTPLFVNGVEIIEQSWLKPIRVAMTEVFAFVEKPLSENQALQHLIANREHLTADDLAFLTQWLKELNIDESAIAKFMEQIKS